MGVAATHGFEIYNCRNSVHIGWVAYGITYFGIVALTFIFFTLGGLSYTFCQYYGGIITNSSTYSQFGQAGGSTSFNRIFQKLNVCFYGNGSILQSYDITN